MPISNYSETNFKLIDAFLEKKGMNCIGRAGLIGNLYAESKLIPNNLQKSYEGKSPYYWTDISYTTAVDNGIYTSFDTDRHGYGLCQWTSPGRKTGYHNLAKAMNLSIGDMNVALEWMWRELNSSSYKKQVLPVLMAGESIDKCARVVMLKFERPANQSEKNQLIRISYAQSFYDKYYSNNSIESTDSGSSSSNKIVVTTLSGTLGTITENNITYNTYTVAKGDTLNKIAKGLNTTKEEIIKLDSTVAKNPNLLKVGQIIKYSIKEDNSNETTPTVITTLVKTESAKSYNKYLSKKYTTTTNLNLRSGAGIGKTKITVIPKGTTVCCYGYYTTVLGTKWLLVQTTINGFKYNGFCSKVYLK